MKIQEYIDNMSPFRVEGVECMCTGVNMYQDREITEEFPFDCGRGVIYHSFFERLEIAKKEVALLLKDRNLSDVLRELKEDADNQDNSNYWGEMISIYTRNITPEDITVLGFDVRMD